MKSNLAITLVLLGMLMTSALAKSVYDYNKSFVSRVSSINFTKQVQKTRETTKQV